MSEEQMLAFTGLIRKLKVEGDHFIFHHGMCMGADTEAAEIVRREFKPDERTIVGHPPIDKRFYQESECDMVLLDKKYLARNREIVGLSEILIAAPKIKALGFASSGTAYTANYAKDQGLHVYEIRPNGLIIESNATR